MVVRSCCRTAGTRSEGHSRRGTAWARSYCFRSSSCAITVEATAHPLRDDRFEFGRSLLPDTVTSLEDVQAPMGQSFAQKRRVSSETVRVVPTDDDCDRHLDRREAWRERRQIFRVRANECRGSRQPIVLVGREIVVADEG